MNRKLVARFLAGVLVALAIPTAVVVALEAVMVDPPDHQEPSGVVQAVEPPLTGPIDPETEPVVPDLAPDDQERGKKDEAKAGDEKSRNKDSEEKGNQARKESPEDIVETPAAAEPLVGLVKAELPLAKACAALLDGNCPAADDLAGTIEQVVEACTDAETEGDCPADDVTEPIADLIPTPDIDALRPDPIDVGIIIVDPNEAPVPTPEIPEPVVEQPPAPDTGEETPPAIELDPQAGLARALLRALGLPEALENRLRIDVRVPAAPQPQS